MSRRPSQGRVLIVAAEGEIRDDLTTFLADLAPAILPLDISRTLAFLSSASSLRVMIIVEQGTDSVALDLLQTAKRLHAAISMFVLSARPTIDHATEAIRRGAEDFVPIPFSKELLRKEIDRAFEAAKLREGIAHLRNLVKTAYGFDQIVSNSARMQPVFERALAASRSDTPVLIVGETGTGKELLARAIHANGARSDRPFVPVNCSALPHELIESELFGHRRGAFSGALKDHSGLFVSAHRGTLMLDEIGDLPYTAQPKLLRVLQDGDVRAVGGMENRAVDVRVIAATNRSTRDLRAGALRQDLFFRLAVLVINLPPLRDRIDDIPRLVQYFLKRHRGSGALRLSGLEPDALDMLTRYHYPGNVRELENLIHNLCATLPPDRNEIRASDIRGWLRRQGVTSTTAPEPLGALPLNLRKLEAQALGLALKQAAGNKSHAAQLLGISRDTLYRKIKDLSGQLSEYLTDDVTGTDN